MSKGNRQRILEVSVQLFNHSGTVAITTNHIARHLKISPGNLYFHFANKEAVVRELFQKLCSDTYAVWDGKADLTPDGFLTESFEVFWTYRFFHREMYHLRRQDPQLAQAWKKHMRRCFRLLQLKYSHWLRTGLVREIRDPGQMQVFSESVLLMATSYLGFFESPDKPASRKALGAAIAHVSQLLAPYYSDAYKRQLKI